MLGNESRMQILVHIDYIYAYHSADMILFIYMIQCPKC